MQPTRPSRGFLGEGSRLREGPSDRMARAAFAPELDAAPWLWRGLSIADMAHTRELIEAGVLDRDAGRALLKALLAAHETAPEDVGLDPVVGDLYNNRDRMLQERFGSDVGRIHTGRARREATTLAWHLCTRQLLVALIRSAAGLVTALVDTARRHRGTLMPDFTYLQHAHPTTLGHYLLGFAYPVIRSAERLEHALGLVNRSPAGSGSVNGSRFALDRFRLAQRMDFAGVVTHTRDAMWAPDIAMTVIGETTALMATVDRVAEELQLWATAEFGFVTLADRHCRTSVIMPQKKNPYSLAMIRGHARSILGDYVAVAGTNLTPSGQPDNRVTSYLRVPACVDLAVASTDLLAEVVTDIQFHIDRMAAQASTGYAYATDLCDYLVLRTGIDNRTAHKIVGLAVRHATDAGADDLHAEDLHRAATELDVVLHDVAEDDVAQQRDLRHLLAVRTGLGAVGALDPMLEDLGGRATAVAQRYETHPINDFEASFLERTRRFLEELA